MTIRAVRGYDGGVNVSSEQWWRRTSLREFLATVWLRPLPTDLAPQRRKKYVVRSANLTLAVLVTLAVAGAIFSEPHGLPLLQGAALALAGVLYIIWSLRMMGHAVRGFLWERGAEPQLGWPARSHSALALDFAVEIALAVLLCLLEGPPGYRLLVWVVLLPPVAFSGLLLRLRGIVLVSGLCVALFIVAMVGRHRWPTVAYDLFGLPFMVVFTVVLTVLAATSERARGEVERLAGELREANRKLREYAVQTEELAATRERNRVAREIHDSLGHYLTVVNVQLEAGRATLECDPARARAALEKAQALTQEGLQEIRRSVAALRASPLDSQELSEALQQVVGESRKTGVAVQMQVLGEVRPLSPQAELTLFRAGQEGLTNVRKHAQASSVQLALDFRATSKVGLSISDNGRGAAVSGDPAGGFGLLGLRERAQLLGGEVRVRTAPGAGFTLEVEVPG